MNKVEAFGDNRKWQHSGFSEWEFERFSVQTGKLTPKLLAFSLSLNAVLSTTFCHFVAKVSDFKEEVVPYT